MPVSNPSAANHAAAAVAAAIGEPARSRMLFALLDGRARTATELALAGQVSASTASAHLRRLQTASLVRVASQGKNRYYRLGGAEVANVLEALSAVAGRAPVKFVPGTPDHLIAARTCYDHIAGTLGVALHDRLMSLGWMAHVGRGAGDSYSLTPKGAMSLERIGFNVDGARASRRRFAYGCLDWSERRTHVGGALGAALLDLALRKKWLARRRESRGLDITTAGRRALSTQFGVRV
jgi:DNA-binding transcriptional ArsR family regulator